MSLNTASNLLCTSVSVLFFSRLNIITQMAGGCHITLKRWLTTAEPHQLITSSVHAENPRRIPSVQIPEVGATVTRMIW